MHKFFLNYQAQGAPSPLDDLEWGSLKTTRKMFIEMCRIDLTMPQEEIARRYRATSMPGYRNLYVDMLDVRVENLAKRGSRIDYGNRSDKIYPVLANRYKLE